MADVPPQYPPLPKTPSGSSGGAAVGGTTQGFTYFSPNSPGTSSQGSPGGSPGGAGSVGGSGLNRQDFIRKYANIIAKTWVDDSFQQMILTDPVNTLAGAGIPTVAGAVIRVIKHTITGSGKIEDQVDAWLEGNKTGLYNLFLPNKPEEFDVPTGGGDGCIGGDNTCCCCPCCCCT